jgi:hypothetical protein
MRAYVKAMPVQSIEARFTYLGAASQEVPLGSGTVRRQVTTMNIYVDQILAWRGPLGADVLKWDERVGIRSDNVSLQFELAAPIAQENFGNADCGSDPSDTE